MHIKLRHNDKRPVGEAWILSDDSQEIEEWIREGFNVGRVVQGIVVVDFDEKEAAREFYKTHREILSLIIETRKGAHFYFSGETQTRKFPKGDIKGNGGYVVCPPSVVSGFRYRIVQDGPLQPFPEELFPRQESPASQISGAIRDLRAYIGKITSTSGKRGSDSCFRVACVLRDTGMSEAEALAELIQWNDSGAASPPWSLKELLHKVQSAYKKGNP